MVNLNLIGFRCTARPDQLDAEGPLRRTRAMTDIYVASLDAAILWRDFGIRSDVTVEIFTSSEPVNILTHCFI